MTLNWVLHFHEAKWKKNQIMFGCFSGCCAGKAYSLLQLCKNSRTRQISDRKWSVAQSTETFLAPLKRRGRQIHATVCSFVPGASVVRPRCGFTCFSSWLCNLSDGEAVHFIPLTKTDHRQRSRFLCDRLLLTINGDLNGNKRSVVLFHTFATH